MNIERAGAGTYRLVLRGELGDQFGFLFAGMRLSREAGTTVLTGRVAGQAHLAGIINRTQELGLELISVGQIDEAPESHAEQALVVCWRDGTTCWPRGRDHLGG